MDYTGIDQQTQLMLTVLSDGKEYDPLTVGWRMRREYEYVESVFAGDISKNFALLDLLRQIVDRKDISSHLVKIAGLEQDTEEARYLFPALQAALVRLGAQLLGGRFHFSVLELKPGGPVLYRQEGETFWDDASWHALLDALTLYNSETARLRKQLAYQRRRADHLAGVLRQRW